MARRKKVTYQGREVEATVLDFTVVDDGTARYRLEDGTVLRVKPVVVAVLRVEDERNDLGEPVFLVQSLVHTMVDGGVDGGEADADDASDG
jgi:hypothetical protein